MGDYWFYIIIGVVAVAVVCFLVFRIMRNKKINENGIEARAVISRIKEIESSNDDGSYNTTYEYFVKYTTQTGEEVEAKLDNPPRFAQQGDQLKIKYLPEKPKYVRRVKE